MSWFTSTLAAVARQLLAGGSSHLLEAGQTILRRSMTRLVDEVAERLKEKLVSYAAAAALALVAAVSLVSAMAEALVALGMPPWASHVLVTAVAGISAWGCVAHARSRRVLAAGDSGRESDSPHDSREFTIKVVREVRAPKSRRRKKRVQTRRVRSGKVRRVTPRPRTTVRVRVAATTTRKKSTKPRVRKRRIGKTVRVRAA